MSAVARRVARRGIVQHLIAADESSLAELQALLATLPICATGRVFIEVPDASWIGPIDVPGRMTVTWLDRSRHTGRVGTGQCCGRGDALSRAVIAWADEMLCAETDRTRIHLMGGYLGTAEIVDHLVEHHGRAPQTIHTPERFGLGTR
nr:SIP domain-containing protein [Microbacterium protaetiae]